MLGRQGCRKHFDLTRQTCDNVAPMPDVDPTAAGIGSQTAIDCIRTRQVVLDALEASTKINFAMSAPQPTVKS